MIGLVCRYYNNQLSIVNYHSWIGPCLNGLLTNLSNTTRTLHASVKQRLLRHEPASSVPVETDEIPKEPGKWDESWHESVFLEIINYQKKKHGWISCCISCWIYCWISCWCCIGRCEQLSTSSFESLERGLASSPTHLDSNHGSHPQSSERI